MKPATESPAAAAELRALAEAALQAKVAASASPAPPSPEQLAAELHELQIHHIELEMQNEELRRAQLELEA